ncbi:DUF2505 domain-containing protein [Intrasporangium sp. DVR]|uniref:DUF2505 domain-containing protein n=1 Tax=Intrasporangium sp. DVR TaxID=3127867 RepID=UPI00313A73FE
MRITETIIYHAPVDVVYAMKTSPEFQERKCADSGALQHDVAVRDNGDGAVVVTRRDLSTDGLPDFVRSIVGARLSVTETYRWGPAGPDGSRDGTLTVEAAGAPVAMRGTVRMDPEDGATHLTIDGDLKAHVPLIGSRIEKAAAPAFIKALRSEHESGRRWLDERA